MNFYNKNVVIIRRKDLDFFFSVLDLFDLKKVEKQI